MVGILVIAKGVTLAQQNGGDACPIKRGDSCPSKSPCNSKRGKSCHSKVVEIVIAAKGMTIAIGMLIMGTCE